MNIYACIPWMESREPINYCRMLINLELEVMNIYS